MKKNIFFALFSAMLLMTACQQHEIDSPADLGDGFTLVGHSDAQTKTAFGTPDANTIPFLWSEGDIIYVNGVESNPLSIGGASAEFTFSDGSVTEGDDVYYGQLIDDEVWVLPFQEGDPAELLDDFGHAKVGEDNTFTLQHYTSYLWLNPWSTEVTGEGKKVSSVTIKAANNIVGKSKFDATNKSFGEISSAIVDPEAPELAQTKELLLEFWGDEGAEPKALPTASSNVDIWAVAVVFPVTTGEIEVIYNFEDGSMASYTHSTKTLEAGQTYRISQEIRAEDLYTLKTLTFEDNALSTYWADLIPGEDEQSYNASPLIYNNAYTWSDETTKISHTFPLNLYGTQDIAGGGYVISTHCGTMDQLADASDIYQYQLSIPLATAHNGSENFCIGYHDSSIDLDDAYKPALEFSDGIARVIDHMYITNASVTMYCIINGSGFSEAYDGDDYLDVVATGYNGETKVGTITFRLAEGNSTLVSDWEKWDLSSLGAVTKVVFHMEEVQIGYESWYCTPMYFAFDDVAVRFPVE